MKINRKENKKQPIRCLCLYVSHRAVSGTFRGHTRQTQFTGPMSFHRVTVRPSFIQVQCWVYCCLIELLNKHC